MKGRGYSDVFIVQEATQGLVDAVRLHITEKRLTSNGYAPSSGKKDLPNYKIRIATLSNPQNFDIDRFSKTKYGTYLEQTAKDGLTIFYLSGFVGKFSAQELLKDIHRAGFKDAYIVEEVDGQERKVRI